MTPKESFRERLKKLRVGEEEEKRRYEAKKREKEEHLRGEGKKRELAELERLEEIAKTQFQPIFELVNQEYLNDRGKITLEKRHSEYWGDKKIGPWAVLRLSWDYERYSKDSWSESSMTLLVDSKKLELKRGGLGSEPNKYAILIDIKDEDWKEKLEENIYLFLSTPYACRFHSVSGEGQDTD